MQEPMVADEDDGERVRVACPNLLGKTLVAEFRQFRVGNAVAMISESPFLDTHG
jgi:hypothetical protein